MEPKQFKGFLSSVENPGQLSLTVASLTKVILGVAATYAVVNGLDSMAVTTQVQQIIDTVATGITAGFTVYHSVMLLYGLVRKGLHALLAKPTLVFDQPATPVVPID